MGGLHTLYNEINGTIAPANGHNESGIRGSIVTPCHHSTCDTCMEVFINLYINNSNSRKTCPFCNTLVQHVGKMYFP